MNTYITLAQKRKLNRDNVALPSVEEYKFLGADEATKKLLAEAVNKILLDAFAQINNPRFQTFGSLVRLVYLPLSELQKRYRDVGLCDSETYYAIAQFWGLNYSPEIYDMMRYPSDAILSASNWP